MATEMHYDDDTDWLVSLRAWFDSAAFTQAMAESLLSSGRMLELFTRTDQPRIFVIASGCERTRPRIGTVSLVIMECCQEPTGACTAKLKKYAS